MRKEGAAQRKAYENRAKIAIGDSFVWDFDGEYGTSGRLPKKYMWIGREAFIIGRKVLKVCHVHEGRNGYGPFVDYYLNANGIYDGNPKGCLIINGPDAFKMKKTKSEPLTLQDLRGMDGEPVWIKELKEWGIVSILKDQLYVCGPGFSLSIENNHLHCYGRKPGDVKLSDIPPEEIRHGAKIERKYNAATEYENTGDTPEEVKKYRHAVLVLQAIAQRSGGYKNGGYDEWSEASAFRDCNYAAVRCLEYIGEPTTMPNRKNKPKE